MGEIEIKDKLRGFLSRSLKEYELKDDDNFVELGLVHSLFMIQLIIFIEKNFGVELDDSLDIDEIKSINDIYAILNQQTPEVIEN